MNQAFDASIPVLTEIVREDAPAPDTPILGTDWQQFEKEISARILQQLQSRVDFVLEQRIRDSIAEVLDQSLRELTGQLREGLHETLGKIVTRAVQQEITHLQAQKK